MGLLRVMMPPKLQLLALLAFALAMFFLENQIQKLEESRGKLGKFKKGGSLARCHPVTALQGHRTAVCELSLCWVSVDLCSPIVVHSRLEEVVC